MERSSVSRHRQRCLLVGISVMAGMVVTASVAWACTANPAAGQNETLDAIYDQVHCQVLHQSPAPCEGHDPTMAPVTFVAHGSGPLYNGKVVDVYQDNDDTDATPGRFLSGIGGCDGGDDVRGTITYGSQTVGNSRVGTGSGVLVATDGPGLYGICAGPSQDLSAIGQFIFM